MAYIYCEYVHMYGTYHVSDRLKFSAICIRLIQIYIYFNSFIHENAGLHLYFSLFFPEYIFNFAYIKQKK